MAGSARRRSGGPLLDFSGAAVAYAKAVEVELNALLFPALRRIFERRTPADREVRVDGRTLDLGGAVPHQTLGALRTLLLHEERVRQGVRTLFTTHDFLLRDFPAALERLAQVRNPAAHGGSLRAAELAPVRDQLKRPPRIPVRYLYASPGSRLRRDVCYRYFRSQRHPPTGTLR